MKFSSASNKNKDTDGKIFSMPYAFEGRQDVCMFVRRYAILFVITVISFGILIYHFFQLACSLSKCKVIHKTYISRLEKFDTLGRAIYSSVGSVATLRNSCRSEVCLPVRFLVKYFNQTRPRIERLKWLHICTYLQGYHISTYITIHKPLF